MKSYAYKSLLSIGTTALENIVQSVHHFDMRKRKPIQTGIRTLDL